MNLFFFFFITRYPAQRTEESLPGMRHGKLVVGHSLFSKSSFDEQLIYEVRVCITVKGGNFWHDTIKKLTPDTKLVVYETLTHLTSHCMCIGHVWDKHAEATPKYVWEMAHVFPI